MIDHRRVGRGHPLTPMLELFLFSGYLLPIGNLPPALGVRE